MLNRQNKAKSPVNPIKSPKILILMAILVTKVTKTGAFYSGNPYPEFAFI